MKRAAGITLIAMLCWILFPATGWTGSASVHVRAEVLPWLRINILSNAGSYTVTEADLRRGYVDLPAAAVVRFETNSERRVRLAVAHEGPERLVVRDPGAGFSVEGTVEVACSPLVPGTRAIDYRLYLNSGTTSGTYPLPVTITGELL